MLNLDQRIDKVLSLLPGAEREIIASAFEQYEIDWRDAQDDPAMQIGGVAPFAPHARQLRQRMLTAKGPGVSKILLDELTKVADVPPNEHGGRRRNRIDRKIAALIAFQLMRHHGVRLKTTKGGTWNQIAALIHGNEQAEAFDFACKVIWSNTPPSQRQSRI